MKKHSIFILLILLGCPGFAQYLVTNGSFEDYYNLPSCGPDWDGVTGVDIPSFLIDNSVGWQVFGVEPSWLTADYIHNQSGNIGCISRNPSPHSGEAHAGIGIYRGYREYFRNASAYPISIVAGTTYLIEFWVKRTQGTGEVGDEISLFIGKSGVCESLSEFIDGTPVISKWIYQEDVGYQRIWGCYTPSSSGQYNICIGPSDPVTSQDQEQGESKYYYIDDVSITEVETSNPITASIEMNDIFCKGAPITINGSGTGVSKYKVDFYKLINGNPEPTPSFSTSWRNGSTPDFSDVQTYTGEIPCGDWLARLEVANEYCNSATAEAEFHIDDPEFSLHLNTDKVCAGSDDGITATITPLHPECYSQLTVQWYLDGTLVAENTESSHHFPNNFVAGQHTIKAIGTTENGCVFEKSVTFRAYPPHANTHASFEHPANVTYLYITAGEAAAFSIYGSHDNALPTKFTTSTLPQGVQMIDEYWMDGNNVWERDYWWSTTPADVGTYQIEVVTSLVEANPCGIPQNTTILIIKVGCFNCPEAIFYENRTPDYLPLPSFTKAGMYIVAGEDVDPNQQNGPVDTGSDPVEFKAGHSITLKPGFHAGPGFWAHIDPTTCVDDCEDCCDNWSGFRYDIPNVFTPNGDGINDIWNVLDLIDPFCAYNAKGYILQIFSAWGNRVYMSSAEYDYCCPFQSKAPNNPIDRSSISWDGRAPDGSIVSDGWYNVTLDLIGCGQAEHLSGQILVFTDAKSSDLQPQDSVNQDVSLFHIDSISYTSPLLQMGSTASNSIESIENVESTEFFVYPNPASKEIFISSIPNKYDFSVSMYNSLGVEVKKLDNGPNKIPIFDLANGLYQVVITQNNEVFTSNIIVKK
ncbi:MAG: gliding motility-associated C-terminal domain-containing protein [Bacteroidetes bacterium]|nr:gliding motility-associated C-terminal domain-containing protein [Bacteroidota bacterium]